MRPRVGFVFGMVFPEDDLLSEWVATLAMTLNDLTLVRDQLEADRDTAYRFLYWLRLAIGHFNEASMYLDETAELDEVKDFVARLSPEARAEYVACLDLYRERKGPAARLRNEVAFHYPRLNPAQAKRPMQRVLRRLAGGNGEFNEPMNIRGSRLLFADDVTAEFFITASGGRGPLEAVHGDISAGVNALTGFAMSAINRWFYEAQQRGAGFFKMR